MKRQQDLKRSGLAWLSVSLAFTFSGPLAGQVCNSTGANGALTFNTPGVYDFDPATLPQSGNNTIADNNNNVFHFSTVTIGPDVRLRLRASKMRSQRPVVFLASGAVTVTGTLELNGATEHGAIDTGNRGPSEPGPGGYPGGAGAKPGDVAQVGAGPGGAGIGAGTNAFGCPAAFATQPFLTTNSLYVPSHCPTATNVYGNSALLPLVGGSGGSGGKAGTTQNGAGGGAGGGAIRICSDVSITIPPCCSYSIPSEIRSSGGSGGPGTSTLGSGWDGGPGSGGSIHLMAPSVILGSASGGGSGRMRALGGSSSQFGGYGYDNASNGRIRIDSLNPVNTADVIPAPLLSTFPTQPLALPNPPTVKVLSVNGVPVSSTKNDPANPDVSINTTGSVPIIVQTTGVPDNTTARFYVTTDPGSPDIVQTATVTANSATLNVSLPQGIDRLLVRVTF